MTHFLQIFKSSLLKKHKSKEFLRECLPQPNVTCNVLCVTWDMESIFTKFALYESKNECVRTDNLFSPISEVCDGTVSLNKYSWVVVEVVETDYATC